MIRRSPKFYSFFIGIIVFSLLTSSFTPVVARASTMANFNPANLISDAEMRDISMSTQQIQNILDKANPTCLVSVCLNNFSENGSSTAQIIKDSSISSSINPRVLISILETQYNLVTDSRPSTSWFNDAMGMPGILGFTNQMNAAANKLSQNTTFNDGIFRKGVANSIPNSTDTACGDSLINIESNATAALYSYPNLGYATNQAAIDSRRGAGDNCSSYGIRNFYIHYNVWFGDLTFYTNVYRFWSDSKKKHFYTISINERDSLINTQSAVWHYEGVAFQVPEDSHYSRYTQVYRFWSDSKQGHFYTISSAERDNIINTMSGIWKYEGVAYYTSANPNPTTNSTVYRFWSDSLQSHFYTSSIVESTSLRNNQASDWRYEGIAYYVR